MFQSALVTLARSVPGPPHPLPAFLGRALSIPTTGEALGVPHPAFLSWFLSIL